MRTSRLRRVAASTLGLATLCLVGLPGSAAAVVVSGEQPCAEPTAQDSHDHGAARGGWGNDTRPVSAKEQRAIRVRTARLLDRRTAAATSSTPTSIPVYVHVMAASDGAGNVGRTAIRKQIAVLNTTFSGGESDTAAKTGFTFTLAGIDRYFNDTWHKDASSERYRSRTRRGGAKALNMWLVDFRYLGIATFPWDYARKPDVDGIRVHYASLPGGSIANYNLGETATHEVGHWLGLYHTFQGGCTELNDEVADTPAQSSPTNGCPIGRDSCELPGLDPIHNYMDYSYDSCYTEFSGGQGSRMGDMWAAYRA